MSITLTIITTIVVVGPALNQSLGTASASEWMLVRTVSNEQGGTIDYVVVSERRRADRAHYESIGNAICGSRTSCMVQFWTDHRHVPTSAWRSGKVLTEMTADYERSPNYKAPSLRLACWLYTSKREAEAAKCFYLPGVKVPWP